jgi:hypothetical protein
VESGGSRHRLDFDRRALETIEQEGWDAPVGSDMFAAIKLAIKGGEIKG